MKRAHGITLSRAQRDEIARRGLAGVNLGRRLPGIYAAATIRRAHFHRDGRSPCFAPAAARRPRGVDLSPLLRPCGAMDKAGRQFRLPGDFTRSRAPAPKRPRRIFSSRRTSFSPAGSIPGWKNSSPPAASRGRLSSLSPGARITARPSPSGTSDSRQTGPSSWIRAGAAS